MLNSKLFFLSILLFCLSPCGFANEINLNCQPQLIKSKNNTILNTMSPKNMTRIYFLKNNTNHTIVIDHLKKNPGAGAGWASPLSAKKWSVLVVSQPQFSLQCTRKTKDRYQKENCHLKICELKRPLDVTLTGNYWLIENKTWPALLQLLKEKGLTD